MYWYVLIPIKYFRWPLLLTNTTWLVMFISLIRPVLSCLFLLRFLPRAPSYNFHVVLCCNDRWFFLTHSCCCIHAFVSNRLIRKSSFKKLIWTKEDYTNSSCLQEVTRRGIQQKFRVLRKAGAKSHQQSLYWWPLKKIVLLDDSGQEYSLAPWGSSKHPSQKDSNAPELYKQEVVADWNKVSTPTPEKFPGQTCK